MNAEKEIEMRLETYKLNLLEKYESFVDDSIFEYIGKLNYSPSEKEIDAKREALEEDLNSFVSEEVEKYREELEAQLYEAEK